MPHEFKYSQLASQTLDDVYRELRSFTDSRIKKNDLEFDVKLLCEFYEGGTEKLTSDLPLLDDYLVTLLSLKPGDDFPVVPHGHKCGHHGIPGYKTPTLMRPFWVTLILSEFDPRLARCIRIVRTILKGFKKLEVEYTPDQLATRISQFLDIQSSHIALGALNGFSGCVLESARQFAEQFMDGYTPECSTPRHGPGAVADRKRGDEKWNFSTIYASIHGEWPYYDHFFTTYESAGGHGRRIQLAALANRYRSFVKKDWPCSRMLAVPKDSRGPRLIACEPSELMYLQQGVGRHLQDFLENDERFLGRINFKSQEINQGMALMSSFTNSWDTIDLSDASDRISLEMVQFLLPKKLFKKLNALRSTHTSLPSGEIVEVTSFATMGSMLCFPVESFVFYTLCVACVYQLTHDERSSRHSVFVYGDDIIIRHEYTQDVLRFLNEVGLKPNFAKCCSGRAPYGSFRESCGVDAWCAEIITPQYFRKSFPSRPQDTSGLVAWVAYIGQLSQFMPSTARYLYKCVNDLLGYEVPIVGHSASYLAVQSDCMVSFEKPRSRYNKNLQRDEFLVLAPSQTTVKSRLDSWLGLERQLICPSKHGYSYVADYPSALKWRWLRK